MNFFGAKKPARKAATGGGGASASPAAAIGKIKEQIRVMEKAEAHLELRIKKLHASAVKKSKAKNKSGALLDLKRKKVLEKQLTNKSNQRFALEQNCFSLEVMHGNVEAVKATKVANGAMASMTSAMYVFHVFFSSWWLLFGFPFFFYFHNCRGFFWFLLTHPYP